MSRVLAAGSLGPSQPIGTDPAQPFYRATLTDPTGTVAITAGGYQPAALAVLRGHQAAGPVLVVGKAHMFRGRDSVGHVSIRAERIGPLTDDELSEIRAEIAAQTAARLELVERARGGEPSASASRPKAPSMWTAAAGRAARAYPSIDLSALRASLGRDGLQASLGTAEAPRPSPTPAPPPRSPRPTPRVDASALSAAERAQESSFLDLIDEVAEPSADGCADLRELLQRAAARGVREVAAEELLNRLEVTGVLEEPVVGKVRRIGAGPSN